MDSIETLLTGYIYVAYIVQKSLMILSPVASSLGNRSTCVSPPFQDPQLFCGNNIFCGLVYHNIKCNVRWWLGHACQCTRELRPGQHSGR